MVTIRTGLRYNYKGGYSAWAASNQNCNESSRQVVVLRMVLVGGKQQETNQSDQGVVVEREKGGSLRQKFARLISSFRMNGQELVEFAIVLPLLLLIIFGVVDLGRLFHVTVAITNAAREGARFGGLNRDKITNFDTNSCIEPLESMLKVVGTEDYNEIIYISCAEGRTSGIDISRMNVTPSCPDPSGCVAFKPVWVTVSYNFNFLLGNFIPGIGDMPGPTIILQRTAEMLIQ